MSEFINSLVMKEEEYNSGLFATVPNYHKKGSAYILTDGVKDNIIVDEYTTTKDIRKGRYKKLVEISTRSYIKELNFSSPSKEATYKFNVYIKAVIQVDDPLLFFENRNIDVDSYFRNLFLQDVKKITRSYSILDFNGMEDELKARLSACNTVDESTGFVYQISVVDAMPDKESEEILRQYSQQQINANLVQNAQNLSAAYKSEYEEAIWTEVAQNKRSQADAIREIEKYNNEKFEQYMNRVEVSREKGFITDKEARKYVAPAFESVGIKKIPDAITGRGNTPKLEIDNLYEEDKA